MARSCILYGFLPVICTAHMLARHRIPAHPTIWIDLQASFFFPVCRMDSRSGPLSLSLSLSLPLSHAGSIAKNYPTSITSWPGWCCFKVCCTTLLPPCAGHHLHNPYNMSALLHFGSMQSPSRHMHRASLWRMHERIRFRYR